MKKIKIIYWIITVIFGGFMIFSGIPGVQPTAESQAFMKDMLGFPDYFNQMISIAKILGGIAILLPLPRLVKEWAYAGLFYDLVGAIISVSVVSGTPFNEGSAFIFLVLLVGVASYVLWKKTNAS